MGSQHEYLQAPPFAVRVGHRKKQYGHSKSVTFEVASIGAIGQCTTRPSAPLMVTVADLEDLDDGVSFKANSAGRGSSEDSLEDG
jgi:hypothetical protein